MPQFEFPAKNWIVVPQFEFTTNDRRTNRPKFQILAENLNFSLKIRQKFKISHQKMPRPLAKSPNCADETTQQNRYWVHLSLMVQKYQISGLGLVGHFDISSLLCVKMLYEPVDTSFY